MSAWVRHPGIHQPGPPQGRMASTFSDFSSNKMSSWVRHPSVHQPGPPQGRMPSTFSDSGWNRRSPWAGHPGIHQPGPPKAFGLRLALSPVHPRCRQPSGSWEAGVQGSPREIGNQGVRASHHGFVPTPHRACSGHELCLIRDH